MLELATEGVTYRRFLPEPYGQLIGLLVTLAILIYYRKVFGKPTVFIITAISLLMTAWHVMLCAHKSPAITIKYTIEAVQAVIFFALWMIGQKKNCQIEDKKKCKTASTAKK